MAFFSFPSSPGCQMRLVYLISLFCRIFIACPTRKVNDASETQPAGFSMIGKKEGPSELLLYIGKPS